MNKNYFSNSMRTMRLVKSQIDEAQKGLNQSIAKAAALLKEDEITKTVYDREITTAQAQYNQARKDIIEKSKSEFVLCFEGMRSIANQQVVTAPTPEMASTLQILSTIEKVTPVQFGLYAEQMSGCPLAMQALSQIAAKHDQRLIVDEPEHRLRLLDCFEGHVVNFLANYNGTEDNLSFSIRKMLPYLQTEDKLSEYGGTKKVDRAFWDEFVGDGNPDCYDENSSSTEKPRVMYFFRDVDGLLSFIRKETENKSGSDVEKAINGILANCPESYGAAYRNYKASGEKIALNE